jgi:methylated-DNA-[protein]-cysteine S-methyltransferase
MAKYLALCHSPLGNLYVTEEDGFITNLDFTCQEVTPEFKSSPLTDLVQKELDEYFAGTRTTFDLPLNPHGTIFMRKVWDSLLTIPYGHTASYKEIACKAGNVKACRAVGMANNRNPIAIIIPCHRVIGSDGALVGYGGGLDLKKALLKLESNHKPF